MDKQLINRAWACLPREYREEIKRMWHNEKESLSKCTAGYILTEIFGYNNLTAEMNEEDEMLTVSRRQVQKIYQDNCKEIDRENVSSSDKDCYETVNETLKALFGSKCLPDNLLPPHLPVTVKEDHESSQNEGKEELSSFGKKARKVGTLYQRTRRNLAAQMCAAMIAAKRDYTWDIDRLTNRAFEIADMLLTKSMKEVDGETSETTLD